MKGFGRSLIQILKQESGQMLYLAAPLCIVFLGMAGLTIDVGNAYVAYRELQASTDAAALAGAYALVQSGATTTTVSNMISSYSSVSGQKNASVNLPGATVTTTFRCVSDAPSMVTAPCAASSTGYNVVQVMQTVQAPTIFISALRLFGINASTSITLRDYATATMMSGFDKQLNVALVVDTTNSMGQNDSACGTTKIKCALGGVQTLLAMMSPCSLGSTSSTCKSVYDQVSMFTFPPIQANTASDDTVCPSSNPSIVPYFAPAEGATWSNPSGTTGSYQVTLQPSASTNDGFFDNYSSTNAANGGINTSSALSVAAGASSCQGMQTPGGDGTYIASSIFAAQSALTAAQANNPGSQNVMILLTDGDANSTSGGKTSQANFPSCTGSSPPSPCISGKDSTGLTVSYPSVNQQCHQSILAANYATAQGTTVYTVSYGSPSTGCSMDTGSFAITPCSELQQMSSGYSSGNTSHFFADSTSACGGSETLNQIFGQIGGQLTSARLIPNGTT
jgi:hypothetical protein